MDTILSGCAKQIRERFPDAPFGGAVYRPVTAKWNQHHEQKAV
jgi:hypothetical protein